MASLLGTLPFVPLCNLGIQMSNRPRVFIASSKEGLPEAKAINGNLDHSTVPTLWPNGTFNLGSHALESLTKKSSDVDFAVFIFTPDDVAEIRGKTEHIVRDNVLFELGLFIGALGRDRCFIVRPRGVDLHLPSDLLGITTVDYAVDRGDNDLSSALNFACTKIEAEITQLGPLPSPAKNEQPSKRRANPPEYTMSSYDLRFLAIAASSHVSTPEGLTHWNFTNEMSGVSTNLVNMSAIKLLRLGYIERTVREDRDGDPYYSLSITEDGIDALLESESAIAVPPTAPNPSRRPRPAPNFSDLDNDVPF